MTESSQDLNARLRTFFATASPAPPGLEDRIAARLGRRRSSFLPGSSIRVAVTTADHPFSTPRGRAARFGAVTAALGTAVALAAVGVASHHVLSGAGGGAPVQQMTATASPVDLSGARAATAALFDPSLPQCWKAPAVKGEPWPADSFAGCPVTSRLGNHLRDYEGFYTEGSILTEYHVPPLPSGVSSQPFPSPGGQSPTHFTPTPHFTITVGAPIATSTGATVKVLASDAKDSYENDAILVHTASGWLIDDILIHGRNVLWGAGAPHSGWMYFMPQASGFPVSLYNPCTIWPGEAPPGKGC